MQRRRFYAPPEEIDASCVRLSLDESHHLIRVLRLKRGDEVFIFDGCGKEYKGRFDKVENQRAALEIVERLTGEVESPLRLTLAQGLAKGEKFDFIVQKATELGVSRIVPLASAHADLQLNRQQADKKVERWQRISLEALKQCGRRRLVEINQPLSLEEFLQASRKAASRGEAPESMLFFNERGGLPLTQALDELADKGAMIALIGPEGGWSDGEIELMKAHKCLAVTLGRRVLRTETAAVVAASLLQHLLGDLSR